MIQKAQNGPFFYLLGGVPKCIFCVLAADKQKIPDGERG